MRHQEDLTLNVQRGVTYVPDFVCNRMGVVNCSMEVTRHPFAPAAHAAPGSHSGRLSHCDTCHQVYGNFPGDPMLEQHFDLSNPDSIPCTVKRVLSAAKERGMDANAAAVMMADEASRVAHPITGHR